MVVVVQSLLAKVRQGEDKVKNLCGSFNPSSVTPIAPGAGIVPVGTALLRRCVERRPGGSLRADAGHSRQLLHACRGIVRFRVEK